MLIHHRRSCEAVKVIVGRFPKRVFLLEHNLLVQHSDFFRAALSGNWIESREREVVFEDGKPEVFEMFGRFIQHRKVYCKDDSIIDLENSQDSDASLPDQHQVETEQLRQAWCLGQTLLSTSFKDAILDAYYELYKESSRRPYPWEAWVYDKSASASCLRKFVVDFGVWHDVGVVFDLMIEETPRQYFIDLAMALKDRVKGKGPATNPFALNKPSCRYHEHVAEGKPCWRTLFKA